MNNYITLKIKQRRNKKNIVTRWKKDKLIEKKVQRSRKNRCKKIKKEILTLKKRR